MASVDPVVVAAIIFASYGYSSTTQQERLALSRVVLAAEERVKLGHDQECRRHALWGRPLAQTRCTCGHDALAAALRGEEGK
jgi:hypothetical protein